VKNYLYSNISFVYDVTVNYIEVHEECMQLVNQIVQNEEILERIKKEIKNELKHAKNLLYNELEDNFPEVIKAVQHKRGGFYLINRMKAFVNEMIEHGQIDFREANFFLHELNKETRNLELNKLKIDFTDADFDFKEHCEIAKLFSNEEIDKLLLNFKEVTFNKNEVIIK